jgi:hypothetical protein
MHNAVDSGLPGKVTGRFRRTPVDCARERPVVIPGYPRERRK